MRGPLSQGWHGTLEQSALAVGGSTVADHLLALHRPHLVVIVPAELTASGDELQGEESDGGEPEVMTLHKDVLHEDVWIAGVVEVATDVALGSGWQQGTDELQPWQYQT